MGVPSPRSRHRLEAGWIAAALLAGSVIPLPKRYNPHFGPYGPDKVVHLAGHAGLTAALVAASGEGESPPSATVRAVVASVGYGVCIELLQEWVPGRAFERADVVAALVGSIVGVAVGRRTADPVAARPARPSGGTRE